MKKDILINTRFSTTKSTNTHYHIVDKWDEAFQQWFKISRNESHWDRIAILTDEHVWSHYRDKIRSSLSLLDCPLVLLLLSPGENSKEFSILPHFVETLLQNGVHRRDLLICIGGGVCCDLGGLLAMLYMRGMDYVNLPTSLMAQIDAAIGGKVGSNLGILKNVLGGFHQPLQVFIDISFLNTVSDIHFRSAMAEAVKIAIIQKNGLFLEFLEKHSKSILNRNNKQILELIKTCLQGKLELIADDPYETFLDRSLNLGHAMAHAIELLPVMPGHRKPLHGEAVSIGLAAEIRYAFKFGFCSKERAERFLSLLNSFSLPLTPGSIDPRQIKSQLNYISNQRGGLIRLVVPVDKGGVAILPEAESDILIECLEPVPGLLL